MIGGKWGKGAGGLRLNVSRDKDKDKEAGGDKELQEQTN
jgi:hypothetical protein